MKAFNCLIGLIFITIATIQVAHSATCLYPQPVYEQFNWGYESPDYTYIFLGLYLGDDKNIPDYTWYPTGSLVFDGAFINCSFTQDGSTIYRIMVIFDYVNYTVCLPDTDGDGIPDKDDIDSKPTEKKDQGKKPEEKFPSCPENYVADPINIFNGNLIEQETDLIFNSPFEGGLTFRRFYNSQSTEDSTIGFGWTYNDNYVLNPDFGDSSQLIEIIDATGRGIYFDDNDQDGIFTGAFSENSKITKDVDDNYIWTGDDGTVYKFEQTTGKLLSITDKNGNIQSFTYNANNLLETITDQASDQILTIYYTASNKIDYITGPITPAVPDGIWVSYSYDANNNLTGVQYADDGNGSAASGFDYRYEDPNYPNNLTSKRDLAGTLLSTWVYNDSDQAIQNINNQGTSVTINYDNPEQVAVTDAYGITSVDHFSKIAGRKKITQTTKPSGCTSCSSGIYKTDYDESTGVPIKREYFNGQIDLFQDYDDSDNPQTIVLAEGSADKKTIYKTYHPDLSAPLTITEKSVFADATNPDRSKVVIYDYDDPNGPSNTDIPNENPSSLIYQIIEQGFTQNAAGQVLPYEHVTHMDYNSKGQVVSINGPLPGDEDTVSYTYDPGTGDLLSTTNPITGTTTFNTDAAGNMIQIIDINSIETSIAYDGRNRPMIITTDGKTSAKTYTAAGLINSLADRDGRTQTFGYNSKGLLDKITDPFGDYLSYLYDANTNLIEASIFSSQGTKTHFKGYDYGDPANNAALSPGKPWKTIVRNRENTANLESVYQYSHGKVSQVVDPGGGQKIFAYDIFKRVTHTIEKMNDTQNAITSYAYDSQNNLVSVTDANANQTIFIYDDIGRLVKQESPDTGTTLFSYDANGNILSKTTNDGKTTNYTYDTLGRLTSILYDDNTQDVIYLYDQGINGVGKLTGISDATGSESITYDTLGNLVKIDKTVNDIVFTTSYTYDGSGNITSMTYPDTRIVAYGYNLTGRINRITTTKNGVTQVLADAISYLPFGPVQALAFGNSLVQTKTFDLQYRPATTSLADLLDLSYDYDPVGNITGITNGIDADQGLHFEYDKARRLIASSHSSDEFSYTYDLVGNWLTRILNGDTKNYQYLNGTNLLDNITGTQSAIDLTYDDNGNIKTKGEHSYSYNQNNRLITASESSTIRGTYAYNHQNQRVAKTEADQTILFHYDLTGNLIAETKATGEVIKSFAYLGNHKIAAIESTPDQNFRVTVHTDKARALESVKVYVFNENNSYTGMFATTDDQGQIFFENHLFDADNYKFRADYLNEQFWSTIVSIASGSTQIEIHRNGVRLDLLTFV